MSLTIFLVFSAAGIGLLLTRSRLGPNITDACRNGKGIFYEIDQLYIDSAKLLCTTECPCTGDVGVTNPLGSNEILGCPGGDSIYTPPTQDDYDKYLRLLENELHCSGMCSAVDHYVFTSTSNGVPTRGSCR